jgi:hypothetical protein
MEWAQVMPDAMFFFAPPGHVYMFLRVFFHSFFQKHQDVFIAATFHLFLTNPSILPFLIMILFIILAFLNLILSMFCYDFISLFLAI